jgi:hypothetical protein
MKVPGGRLSESQIDFHGHASANGYCVEVCFSLAQAQLAIDIYMGLNRMMEVNICGPQA